MSDCKSLLMYDPNSSKQQNKSWCLYLILCLISMQIACASCFDSSWDDKKSKLNKMTLLLVLINSLILCKFFSLRCCSQFFLIKVIASLYTFKSKLAYSW